MEFRVYRVYRVYRAWGLGFIGFTELGVKGLGFRVFKHRWPSIALSAVLRCL